MIQSEKEILAYLDQHNITYERIEHPPVYTCQQADLLRPEMPGPSTKNLFLQEGKNGQLYLLLTDSNKRLDMKALKEVIGASAKLRFASTEKLADKMGVTPGAVTLLGLVNDNNKHIELIVDACIWQAEYYLCHPLVNTATLVLSREDIIRFFEICRHPPRIVDVPGETIPPQPAADA